MTSALTNKLYQQMQTIRGEINTTSRQVSRETQTLSREVANILMLLEKRNREVETKLLSLNKMIYSLSFKVKA